MRMSLNRRNAGCSPEASIGSEASITSAASVATEAFLAPEGSLAQSTALAPSWPLSIISQRRRRRAVLQHRLAHDLHLHLALDALDHAHEQMVGVVVGRRARVARAVLVVVPLADRERVDHPQPSLRRHPGRLDDVGAGDVAPAGRDVEAVGPHPPAASAAVEQRAEHRRRVEVRQAHPLDRTVRGDERAGVAVGQKAVVGDRRKRRVGRRGCRAEVGRRAHQGPPSKVGRSTPAGNRPSSSSLSRWAASVRGGERPQPGGHLGPGRVEQLIDRATALVERRDQAVLAIHAVGDVLVELRLRLATRTGRGRGRGPRDQRASAAARDPACSPTSRRGRG